jgi:Flp pilus assembly protein TadG
MVPLRTRIHRLRHSERGVEFIEMALVLPLLLLVVLGIAEFGLLFQQYEVITNAAREGARIAVLPDYTAADARNRATAYVTQSIAGGAGGTPTVTVGAPVTVDLGGGHTMTTVTVTVTYPHPFTFLSGIATYFGSTFGTATLTATSTMRTEAAGG